MTPPLPASPADGPSPIGPPIGAPTTRARRWVRYLLGFGVGVGVGLAPYLGRVNVPGFSALLTMLPDSLRDTALPLSAAVMGLVAVCVQWYGEERLSRAWLRRAFAIAAAAFVAALVAFAVVQSYVVVPVHVGAENFTASFLVGFDTPDRPPCPRAGADAVGDAECIKRLTLDDARVAAFWGDRSVRVARLALLGSYLAATGAFAALVGLVLLREVATHRIATRGARGGRRPRPRTAPAGEG